MNIKIVLVAFITVACSFASLAIAETEHVDQSSKEALIDGVWSLTSQSRPLNVEDIAQALHFAIGDYDDRVDSGGYTASAWKHRLVLRGAGRDDPNAITVLAVKVSRVIRSHNPMVHGTMASANPFEQVIQVTLRPPSCLDGKAVETQLGIPMRRESRSGFADVLPATFNVLEHDDRGIKGELEIAEGCQGSLTIRITFDDER